MKVAIKTEKPIKVLVEDVRQNIEYGRSINQLIRMVKPELEKQGRKKFRATLIQMFDSKGRKPHIRFDEQITFKIELKNKKATPDAVGKTFSELGWSTQDDIAGLEVVSDDLNKKAAHAFIVRMDDFFWLAFDLRYNQEQARMRIDRAKEFLSSVKLLNLRTHYFPASYLLWSVYELVGDALLYSVPNAKVPNEHNKKIEELLKLRSSLNLPSEEFMNNLLKLDKIKKPARYPGVSSDPEWIALHKRKAAFLRQAILIANKELKQNPYLRKG